MLQITLDLLSYLWLRVCVYLFWMDHIPLCSWVYRHCNTAVFLNLGVPVVTNYLLSKSKGKNVVELSLVEVGRVVIVGDKQTASKLMSKGKDINELRFGTEFGLKKINMFDKGTIWNTDIHKWYDIRKMFDDSVKHNHLQEAVHVALGACQSFDGRVKNCKGLKMDMLDEFRRITMEVTLNLMFGSTEVGINADEMIAAIVEYFKAWEYYLLRPQLFTTKLSVIHDESVRRVNELASKVADYIIENNDELPDRPTLGTFRRALINGFENNQLTKDEMIQCIIEMLLAGSDTSSVSMYYTMVCLLEDSDCEKEILEEFKTIQESSLHDFLSSTEEGTLEYCLSKVFVEAMRIKPVGPVIMRRASSNVSITISSNKKKYAWQEGTNFIFDLNYMNLDPENYTNPKTFNAKRDNLVSMFPFGKGPKSCAGRQLARVEMQTIFYHLFKKYRFGYMDGITEAINKVETHWDIANQPCTTKLFWVIPRKVKFIFISGSHSVGKTTLIETIMKQSFSHYFKSSGKELGRSVLAELGFDRDQLEQQEYRKKYQQELMERQIDMVREEFNNQNEFGEIVLFDRSPIDNMVYSKLFSGEDLYEIVKSMIPLDVLDKLKSEECLHIVINPTKECHKDDGVRMDTTFEVLEKFTSIMKAEFKECGIPYREITSINDRVGQFLEILSAC